MSMSHPPGNGGPILQEAERSATPRPTPADPYAKTASVYERARYADLRAYPLSTPYTPGPIQGPAAETGAGGAPAPLRITHLGPNMLRGGVEMWLRGLIRHLDPGVARVVRCLVSQPDHIDPAVAAEMGVPVEVGDRDSVRRAVADSDVLLCWGPRELPEWVADCPPGLCVFIAHGEGYWTRYMLEGCAPVVDHVVAVSRRVEEAVGALRPTTCIPNGVDAARLGPTRPRRAVRESLGFCPEDFVLGYVGRLSDEKRPHLPLEAVALLPPSFKALVVGWGPLRVPLLELANDRLPGRYAFARAGDDVGDYYAAMDALCLASSEEGFALVILEAMLCGRPVIATPVGCVPEVIEDRVNGLVVPGTPASIAEAADLLSRHRDWARGLAAEGRAYAEEHGLARTMARHYEELLVRLWRQKHPA
jgi:glycosyltransferase involved in cell wall biosynthesis